MKIIDITRLLSEETAPWPGDTPFSRSWTGTIRAGDHSNVSLVRFSAHLGTHIDAPYHIDPDGSTIDALPLAPFLGPARVLAVTPDPSGVILPDAFTGIDLADPPRILIQSGTPPKTASWPDHFAYLAPESAKVLIDGGAILIGMDTPSVDPPGAEKLVSHNLLLSNGLCMIENLDLSVVTPGLYELAALPLRIAGGDAGPVRAVLISR